MKRRTLHTPIRHIDRRCTKALSADSHRLLNACGQAYWARLGDSYCEQCLGFHHPSNSCPVPDVSLTWLDEPIINWDSVIQNTLDNAQKS